MMKHRIPLGPIVSIAFSCALLSCDSLVSHRMVLPSSTGSKQELVQTIRSVLSAQGFHRVNEREDSEEWRWRDPENPPGMFVYIDSREDGLELRLTQEPYGPINATEKYKQVKAALEDALAEYSGTGKVKFRKAY